MNPALLGYGVAVLSQLTPEERRVVADELGALERAATSDPALRAALTDTSIPRGPRRAFLADVLATRISVPAARIAAYAAFSTDAQDVPVSLAEAAQRAWHYAEVGAVVEPGLSVLAARRRVGGYADAVFEEVPVSDLDGVEDELFVWARSVEADAQLRQALTNRDLSSSVRAHVVQELLAARARPLTVRLAAYAVVGGRARDLVGTLDWLVDRVAEERGWRVARVRTALDIDEATAERLAATLRTLVGRPVELEVDRQPELLGGVLVEVGDLRVDATARGRLQGLREHFTLDRRAAGPYDVSQTTQGAS
jgi:F-type H+-transporting ATPase subunit delta